MSTRNANSLGGWVLKFKGGCSVISDNWCTNFDLSTQEVLGTARSESVSFDVIADPVPSFALAVLSAYQLTRCDSRMYHYNLISSGLSQAVTADGMTYQVNIARFEGNPNWSLEIIDAKGTSIVWEESFQSAEVALGKALLGLKAYGAALFRHERNIVPFQPRE